MAASAWLLEETIWSRPGFSPGSTSSSPVAISATTGLRRTASSARIGRCGEADVARH